MGILLFSLSCVAPFFIYLSIGYACKRLLNIGDQSFFDMNKLAFYSLLPASLFINIYNSDLSKIDFGGPLLFSIIAVAITTTILWFYYNRKKLPNIDKGVLIQAVFRTNFVLFGVPLTERITGHPASGLGGILTAVIIPSFNVMAAIVLSIYSDSKPSIGGILKKIAKNPLIIGAIVGVIANLSGIKLGEFSLYIIKNLAGTAIPISLISLGGRFEFTPYEGGKAVLGESLFFRLILIPAVVTTAAALLGFRGETLALLLVLFATPPSTSTFTMAQQMGCNGMLAAKILVYGTILSSITLFIFVSVFKSLGMI